MSNFYEGESTINFVCKYKSSRYNDEVDITFDELNELRDRALISNPKDYLFKNVKILNNKFLFKTYYLINKRYNFPY